MQVIGDIFNLLLLQPIINLIVLILRGLEVIHVPGTLGLAIIILTILTRLVLWPFMSSQMKSMKKMAELKPHLDKLKVKHDKDKQALATAQMALYKEHGVNPAGGCLPAVVQILLIYPLYQVFLAFFEGHKGLEKINYFLYNTSWHLDKLPDPFFLGFNLADKPADFMKIGLVVLIIPVLTALLQFVQTKMMMPKQIKEYPSDSPKEKKEKEGLADSMQAMQTQMMYLMPLMIGYFAFTFPIGIALYWNALSIVSIIQQYRVSGWGSMESLVGRVLKR